MSLARVAAHQKQHQHSSDLAMLILDRERSLFRLITTPVFSKIKVNGEDAHPLYKFLKSQRKGVLGSEAIKWNFTKFLVGPDGAVLKRYGSMDTPEQIEPDVAAFVATAPR